MHARHRAADLPGAPPAANDGRGPRRVRGRGANPVDMEPPFGGLPDQFLGAGRAGRGASHPVPLMHARGEETDVGLAGPRPWTHACIARLFVWTIHAAGPPAEEVDFFRRVFPPPSDLMFERSFDEVRAACVSGSPPRPFARHCH